MKGAALLATLRKLGVIRSTNRPGVSSDNAYSESLFRTLKYVPYYPVLLSELELSEETKIKFN